MVSEEPAVLISFQHTSLRLVASTTVSVASVLKLLMKILCSTIKAEGDPTESFLRTHPQKGIMLSNPLSFIYTNHF